MSQYIKSLSCCLALLILTTAPIKAQVSDEDDAVDDKENIISQPVFAIKFAPIAFLSTTPAVQFGVEAKTFNLQGLQVEFGYVTSAFLKNDSEFDGIKLKSEYRFYKKLHSEGANQKFIGVQHMYKTVNVAGDGIIWRYDRSYQEVTPLKFKNKINSIFLVGGFSGRVINNLYLEIALGLGTRFLNVQSDSNLPEDAELITDLNQNIFNPIREVGNYRFIDMFFSFKFVYSL